MEITSFEELIDFIQQNELSIENISKLVKESIGLHIVFYSNKNELINNTTTIETEVRS